MPKREGSRMTTMRIDVTNEYKGSVDQLIKEFKEHTISSATPSLLVKVVNGKQLPLSGNRDKL
jgi:hypothetical protein